MSSQRITLTAALVVLMTALSACSRRSEDPALMLGGQTGDEGTNQHSPPSGIGNSACDSDESEFDRSKPTAFGISVEELVAGLNPPSAVPFFWKTSQVSGVRLVVSHSGSETTLALKLQLGDNKAYEIRDKPWEDQDDFDLCSGVAYDLPVSVQLTTTDGALDERFTTYMTFGSRHSAFLQHSLEASALAGNLELSSDEHEWDQAYLDVTLLLRPSGSTGRIQPRLEGASPIVGQKPEGCDTSSGGCAGLAEDPTEPVEAPSPSPQLEPPPEPHEPAAGTYLATWPGRLECNNGLPPLASDADVLGVSAQDIVERFAEQQIVLETGAALTFDFPPLPETICISLGRGSAMFSAPVQLTVSESEFQPQLKVRLNASTDLKGELTTIQLWQDGSSSALSVAQVEQLVGFVPDGSNDYEVLDLALRAKYELVAGEWMSMGSITLFGHNAPAPPVHSGTVTELLRWRWGSVD